MLQELLQSKNPLIKIVTITAIGLVVFIVFGILSIILLPWIAQKQGATLGPQEWLAFYTNLLAGIATSITIGILFFLQK
jgi:hypothetical protein